MAVHIKKYEQRKQRIYGHRRALVFTGQSETMSGSYTVKATRYGATIAMPTPRLNFARVGGELTKMTRDEKQKTADVWAEGYARKLDDLESERSTEAT